MKTAREVLETYVSKESSRERGDLYHQITVELAMQEYADQFRVYMNQAEIKNIALDMACKYVPVNEHAMPQSFYGKGFADAIVYIIKLQRK